MNTGMGKLEGRGEVRGPDGRLKGEFILTADCTPEQAQAVAAELNLKLEENDDGCNAR